MRRSAFGWSRVGNLARWSGPLLGQCYQESLRLAYRRLRRPAARWGGNISAGWWLENAAPTVNCPGMDNASQIYDTAVIGGGPAGLTAARGRAPTDATNARLTRR